MADPGLVDSILVEAIDSSLADASDVVGPGRPPDTWTLSLDDLIPDEGLEIVLVPPDNASIELATSISVADMGVASNHVTTAGIDVDGLHYIRFESGTTLYYDGDLTIAPL